MTSEELQAIRERVEHDRLHPYSANYNNSQRKVVARFADGRIERRTLSELDKPYLVANPKMQLSDVPKLLDYINELESMPLVKMTVEQQREIERWQTTAQKLNEIVHSQDREIDKMRKALKEISNSGDKTLYSTESLADWARQALESESHATL